MSIPPALPQDTLVHSYLFLRRAIGLIGTALPFVLIIGNLLVGSGEVLSSVSGYYYSELRDVYVGSMCAVGVFLLSYRGHGRVDDITGNVAAAAAVGVALFPTTPSGQLTRSDEVFGVLHVVCAAVFFLALAFFCLVLFTRTEKARPQRRRVQRNGVYVVSGIVILVCMALLVVFGWLLEAEARSLHPALWLEAVATLAFGVAWLTKGQAILRDLSPEPEQTPPPAVSVA
jgi:putative copper export protein